MIKSLRSLWPICLLSLLTIFAANAAFAQSPPNLGTSSTYGVFSGNGAIGNTGLTLITGDIGTYVGSFTGFPPGQYTGAKHVADAAALSAKNDLTLAYNSLNDATHAVIFDTALNATMGNGQVLTPRTYGRGDLTTLSGNLTFDAKNNPAAVFIIKIRSALNVSANTKILLVNGAQAANIYWAVDGAVSVLDNSIMEGTFLANGAIHLYGGSTLEGRALAVFGAVTMASNQVTVPGQAIGSSIRVITPAAGDTVTGGTQHYQITYSGTGIAANKTFDYSLDSGLTWTLIGTLDSNTYTYSWNVPDTASKNAIVRITDANGLVGKSGNFVIKSSKANANLVVVRPGSGETIVGGTQNYPITFTGNNLATQKTFEYSLDGGTTWKTIGVLNADVMTYPWNVPDTASTRALVRITDKNGITGTSGLFTILSSKVPMIVVTRPTASESIVGGTQGYEITWTGIGIANKKTLELSLDNGMTWSLIAVIHNDSMSYAWSVPDTATMRAMIRITDSTGLTGKSGVFTITSGTNTGGSINSLTLSGLTNNNIGNNQTLGIAWTYTPDIGSTVLVEYLLNNANNWQTVTTVPVEQTSTTWVTPATGYYPIVYIRVTGSKGMSRTSSAFSIGNQNAVANDPKALGYALSNYPNPVSGATTISFALPVRAQATIVVSDAVGREVMRVSNGNMSAGTHTVNFNAANLPSGVYTYRLLAGSTMLTGKMNIIR